MRINIANPIYDSVFKYLVEDERIARTLISALLKREVVRVKVRPHEYANTNRDNISMFRIDFAATVVDESGKEKLATQIENNKKQILEYWEELPPVFISSSETGLGREEILDYIGTVLESVEEENQHPQI